MYVVEVTYILNKYITGEKKKEVLSHCSYSFIYTTGNHSQNLTFHSSENNRHF